MPGTGESHDAGEGERMLSNVHHDPHVPEGDPATERKGGSRKVFAQPAEQNPEGGHQGRAFGCLARREEAATLVRKGSWWFSGG